MEESIIISGQGRDHYAPVELQRGKQKQQDLYVPARNHPKCITHNCLGLYIIKDIKNVIN